MSNNVNDDKNTTENSCNNSCFFSLPPKQFASLAAVFGLLLIDDLSIDQQSALGNFLLTIGQTILTASAQEQALQSCNPQDDQVSNDIEALKKEIESLKKKIDCHT